MKRNADAQMAGSDASPAETKLPRVSSRADSTRSLAVLGIACLLAVLAAPCPAAEPNGAASRPAERKAPPVTVLDLSGRTVSGRLVQADLPGAIRLDVGGRILEIPASQVIWLGFDLRPQASLPVVQWFSDPSVKDKPKPAVRARLVLRDGQVLAGALRDPRKPDSLALEHRLLGSVDLPLGQASEIHIQAEATGSPTRKIPTETAAAFDVLWLANGDRIEGILRSLGSEKINVELASGQQAQMPAASVQVVRLAEVAGSASALASPSGAVQLRLRNGERITVAKVAWNREQAEVTFDYQGRPIALPAGELAGIEPATDRWQWLSDRVPAAYEHQPLLAPPLKWQANATAGGTPITCNANPVLHGLGMPAGSTIRYDLAGECSRLVVWPMLDDSAGPDGSCKARIVADGQPLWQGIVKAAGPSAAVIVDLVGKRELVLQVEAGQGGDVLTRFVWAWPVLVRP